MFQVSINKTKVPTDNIVQTLKDAISKRIVLRSIVGVGSIGQLR